MAQAASHHFNISHLRPTGQRAGISWPHDDLTGKWPKTSSYIIQCCSGVGGHLLILNAVVEWAVPYSLLYRGVWPQLNLGIGVCCPCSIAAWAPIPSITSGCIAPAQLLHGPPTQHHIGVRCPCSIATWVFKAAQGRMAPSHHGAHQGALPRST